MKKTIQTNNAPQAVGPYSQAIDCGDIVFLSGQIPIVPETGCLVEGDITAQTHQIFQNIKAVLEAAGLSMDHVVKTTVYMTNLADFGTLNEIYATYFSEPFPARSCVGVSSLPKGAQVECEVIAKR